MPSIQVAIPACCGEDSVELISLESFESFDVSSNLACPPSPDRRGVRAGAALLGRWTFGVPLTVVSLASLPSSPRASATDSSSRPRRAACRWLKFQLIARQSSNILTQKTLHRTRAMMNLPSKRVIDLACFPRLIPTASSRPKNTR